MKKNKLIKEIFEAPAETLEKGIEVTRRIEKTLASERPVKTAREYWKNLGPGLTTGAADDDPSGIATYSQAGAKYGFGLLWLAPLTFPLMAVVQEVCARIGMVTGRGLAANIRHRYSKTALYVCAGLLFFANTFNIGADLGVMAKSAQLLAPGLSFVFFVVFFALLSLALQIFIPYRQYSKYLKYLSLALVSYIISAFMMDLPWGKVLSGALWPHVSFTRETIFLICAVLGTTISPYLFFWQTSQEVEEEILEGRTTLSRRRGVSGNELKKMRVDVWSGMFFSNLIMFFIIAACAGTLFQNGITDIASASDAIVALRPIAGNAAALLFAIGVAGIGLLAVPVLAGSASYALSESFGWKSGLNRKLKQAYAFYGVIIVSLVLGLVMNFIGLDPIKALIYAAVVNGLVAPVMLFFILRLGADKNVMGQHVIGRWTGYIGWATFTFMVLAGMGTIIGLVG